MASCLGDCGGYDYDDGGNASAYLGRYTGTSRMHTESDLRLFFTCRTVTGRARSQLLTPGCGVLLVIESSSRTGIADTARPERPAVR